MEISNIIYKTLLNDAANGKIVEKIVIEATAATHDN